VSERADNLHPSTQCLDAVAQTDEARALERSRRPGVLDLTSDLLAPRPNALFGCCSPVPRQRPPALVQSAAIQRTDVPTMWDVLLQRACNVLTQALTRAVLTLPKGAICRDSRNLRCELLVSGRLSAHGGSVVWL
jgi:hypothetical protein